MDRREFLESLPLTEPCHSCGAAFRPAYWEVHQCGPGEWLGLCVHQCDKCQHLHIAAAGSTKRAHLEAQRLREKLIREIPKK